MANVSMALSDVENAFMQALATAGLSPKKAMSLQINTSKPIRYQVDGDKAGSENGWYQLSNNLGIYAGAFGSWKTGELHAWCEKTKGELSPEERAKFKAQYVEQQRQHALEKHNVQADAAKKANHLWGVSGQIKAIGTNGSGESSAHAYLSRKGIRPYGIRQLKDGLVIPLRNTNGDITSLQFIQPDGSKRFLSGGQIDGCYFAIGRVGQTLLVCEGYATGATLFESTGLAVAIAFNSGNLVKVCKALRDKYADVNIIVCADNDQTTVGNPGLSKAQEGAGQVGGMVLVPTFDANQTINGSAATDFNDLYLLHGIDAVKSYFVCDGAAGKPVASQVNVVADGGPVRTKVDFELLIDESDDFDWLTDALLGELAVSKLKKPAIEALIGQAAKKSGSTKAALLDVYREYVGRFGPNVPEQSSDDEIIVGLNQSHAVLPMGGRVVIMNREHDPVQGKKLLTFSSKSDFELKYCNRKIYSGGDEVGWGEYWLNHPDRAEYKGMVFLPGENEPGYLNLWQGWGIEPTAGECGHYLDFVFETICSKDDELYAYIMNWCAHLVQKPQELPETALVFRGREGIGKNTFIDPLARIVGSEHYLMLSSLNQITGRFSGHLANALLIFCNESVWGGDKSAQGVLKSMITDPIQPIEYKGRDLSMVKSFRRCIFATNEQWAVPRGADDRRYVITDVSDARKGDWNYFKTLNVEMSNGGTAALYAYLLGRDISEWHPRQIPGHILKRGWEMKIMSASSVIRWWMDMLQQGGLYEADGYADAAGYVWPEACPQKTVEASYLSYCKRYNITHPEHSSTVGRMLHDLGVRTSRPRGGEKGRYLSYKLPTVDEAREMFSVRWGIPDTYWAEHEIGNAFA